MTRFDDARVVFFDLDNTIYDFERSMHLAFAHLRTTFPDELGKHSVEELSKAYFDHYHGMPEHEKVELINRDPDAFRLRMWAGALAGLGRRDVDALARLLTEEFMKVRPQHWRAAMYPGARELLLDLKARGRTLGIITNGPSAVQRPKLEAVGYRDFVPERLLFVSGEFGARKPDARIFLAAAKAAGAEPRACVMIGDAVEFDMPAKAVGFRTILFAAHRPVVADAGEHAPDAIATTYDELRRLLGATL